MSTDAAPATVRGLSGLHPGGFSHVPVAMLNDPRVETWHLAVYLAIAHHARPLTEGSAVSWVARGLSRAEIHRLSKIRDREALRRRIRELEAWGYVSERQVRFGGGRDFVLHVTAEVPSPEVQVHPADSGCAPIPYVQVHPADRDSAPEVPEVQVHPAVGVQVHPASEVQVHPAVLLKSRYGDSADCGCAGPHPPFLDCSSFGRLRKAVGAAAAQQASLEVMFRLAHPEVAGVVERPKALMREIGQCYAGRCRRPEHSEVHGPTALRYHSSRRADVAQLLKSRSGDTPEPELSAELRAALADAVEATTPPPDDFEAHRRAQLEALRRFETDDKEADQL